MHSSQPFRFAISATFTAEPIQPVISFWGRRLNTEFEIRFAAFNQLLQTLLDPAGAFAANHHGANVLLLRLEDLAGFDGLEQAAATERLNANLHQLLEVLRDCPARMSVPVLLVLCPASPEFLAAPNGESAARAAELLIGSSLEDVAGVQFLSHAQIEKHYPVADLHSPEGQRLGRIPYTPLYFCALGTAIVRHAHSLVAPPHKVIALDCDYTLWSGICGEDGPEGVSVTPPHRALQSFMVEQRENGMLLALASKNNEADVLETFAHHTDMPLALRHFTARRLNWAPKSENLADLAAELSLGLDSVIFVDDNPRECAEVEESLPGVLTVPLPGNADEIPRFLDHVWAFDHPVVTEEDRNRNAYYAQSQEFGRELKRSTSLEEFMHSLDLQVASGPMTDDELPRVAQLTQRTNQFNLTTIRRTEAEIVALLESGYECHTVRVSDRFGDYGLVGVMIFREGDDSIDLDTMLLSCRALGRGVEHRMLAQLGQLALDRGHVTIVVALNVTKKNSPAQQFVREAGGGAGVNRLSAESLSRLEWTMPAAAAAAPRPVAPRDPAGLRKSVDYVAIARTLSTAEDIASAMRAESAGEPASTDAPLDDIESRLAVIWSELLQRPGIKASDNFFDLGGHSLLAVLLIMRVRETFGVELPIDDVYSGTLTLGELAHRIESYQLGVPANPDYDALLREIEGLSDEEVARLLAEEDPGALQL